MNDRRFPARVARLALNVVLALVALAILAPFAWVFAMAFTPQSDAFRLPPEWLPKRPTLDNFTAVFELIPFWQQTLNSLKIATLTTLGVLVVSLMAAYAFSRLRFPGRNVLFVVLLAALMVPHHVTVIPTFMIVRWLGWHDTHEALWVPALINVFAIFLLRQFMLTIPRELDEAARIDGAGHVQTLVRVLLPLCGPALATVAIFVFQASWNDFFWANVFLVSDEKMTLPVGLVALQGFQYTGPAVNIFAAVTMIVVPVMIVVVAAQRQLTESFAATGLSGR